MNSFALFFKAHFFQSVLSIGFYQSNQSMSKFTGFYVLWKWWHSCPICSSNTDCLISEPLLLCLSVAWSLGINLTEIWCDGECIKEILLGAFCQSLSQITIQHGWRLYSLADIFLDQFLYVLSAYRTCLDFFVKGFSIKTFPLCLKRRTRWYNLFTNRLFVVIIACCVVQNMSVLFPPLSASSFALSTWFVCVEFQTTKLRF